jgi:Mg2+ and Co2+ transporter CorA
MTLSKTLQGQTLLVKESKMIINIGGIKILCSAEKAMLFDPSSLQSRRFLEILIPKLKFGIQRKQRKIEQMLHKDTNEIVGYSDKVKDDYNTKLTRKTGRQPFELEMIESALMVSTGWLDSELLYVTRRLHQALSKLPQYINPKNLEDLRKVKSALVELESRADALRELLEELLEDEDELREFNLTSRPIRQEKQSRRERERLDRKLERERIALEGSDEEPDKDWKSLSINKDRKTAENNANNSRQALSNSSKQNDLISNKLNPRKIKTELSVSTEDVNKRKKSETELQPRNLLVRKREQFSSMTEEELIEEDYEDAIEDLYDEKEAEKELAEIEDLFEYYLQRAVTTQAEAQRSLQLARDLEESIGVNLSARRFEVNRLELSLAIGSFAASTGALITGVFGMNLKSYLEETKGGFACVCVIIALVVFLISFSLYRHTKAKRIL